MSDPGTWKSWEGRSVEGKFPLRQWLGGSDHSAVFLTERPGQASQKAAIKLIAADPADADQQLSRWRGAAQLSNPHLMRLFECGRCRLDNTALLYLVMEFAEEDLSQILPQRALAPAEVTDLLPPLLDALSFLHGKGFVHGRVMPSNVLATGDLLKLSADQITASRETHKERRRDVYDAPERATGIVSFAGDVWSVGVTLVAALTQNVSFDGESAQSDPTLPQALPQPFRGIARECLHLDPLRRCSLADIQARLQPAARSVPAEPEAPPSPRRTVKRGPIAAVLLVAAVLIAAIIFFARGRSANVPAPETATPALAPKPEASVSQPVEAPRKAATSRGAVVHQVLPEVSPSARNTINGTIKVSVHVDVGPSGRVIGAKFKSAGPSKYFAGLAMKAAEQWEFSPPEVDGQPTTSAWLLTFRFKRGSTQVTPERVTG